MVTKTETETNVRDALEAWNAHDIDRIIAGYAEDATLEDVATGAAYRGRSQQRNYLNRTFTAFPDFGLQLKSVIGGGQAMAMEMVMVGTSKGEVLGMKPTGKCFSVRIVSIIEISGGKISRHSIYYDSAGLMRQLGLVPSMGQRDTVKASA